MGLLKKLISSFFLWLLVTVLLLLIILIPRDAKYERVGSTDVASYQFTWEAYRMNVEQYAAKVWETKSFGKTRFDTSVEEEFFHYMNRSLLILVPALFISIFIGILKGIFDYRHTYDKLNVLGNGTTWFFQSFPDFFLIVVIQFGLLTLMKYGFPKIDLYGYDYWYNSILPLLFLCVYPIVYIARITSPAIAEQDRKDYIRTAKAKGISEKIILHRHILKNCWPKILSQFLSVMLTLISSMIIVEYLTFYRGAGKRLIDALQIKTVYSVGSNFRVEIETIVGFTFGFMVLILLSLWIQQILSYYLIPIKREEN